MPRETLKVSPRLPNRSQMALRWQIDCGSSVFPEFRARMHIGIISPSQKRLLAIGTSELGHVWIPYGTEMNALLTGKSRPSLCFMGKSRSGLQEAGGTAHYCPKPVQRINLAVPGHTTHPRRVARSSACVAREYPRLLGLLPRLPSRCSGPLGSGPHPGKDLFAASSH